MTTIRLGDVTVSSVVEIGRSSFPTASMLPDSTPEAIAAHHSWLKPHFFDEAVGDLGSRIQTFVVRTPRHTVLIDTCVGNDKNREGSALWHMRAGTYLDDLEAAGVTPSEVDYVVCTHLHIDHVGWNTRLVDGRWVPTFPRARYLFARREWEFWREEYKTDRFTGDPYHADSIVPILDAGLADLVETDQRIDDGVWLEPTPGHTPGHVCVHVAGGGREAVMSGDLMHHALQCAEPD